MTDLIVGADGTARLGARAYRCVVGSGGVVAGAAKREGDGATPAGRWPLRRVFWRPDRGGVPETALPVRALAPADGWCDDPDHAEYNRLVSLPLDASHEAMWRDDHLYDLVVEVGYNDNPVVAGKGSAIFLHLMREDGGPTAGCVAFKRADLEEILAALDAGSELVVEAP